MNIHILDDWFDTLRGLPSFALLQQHDVTVHHDHVTESDDLAKRLQAAEVLVLFRERTTITAELLERLPNLKLISQRSVYPHIDVEACTQHEVLLCSNMHAGSPSYAAAELTWALILTAMRQLPEQIASLKAGQWQMGVGKSLRGRTIGLYGYGRIGKTVATYAEAFGMNVMWWGSEDGRARAINDGQYVPESRQAFFSQADVVSIHVRLKPSTQYCISLEDLSSMSSSAVFVNTSRAQLVAKGAIIEALNLGTPDRVAVDVFDDEPNTNINDPLLEHPKVIATPHIGFVTTDELDKQFADIYEQINAYATGSPIHMINAEVWQKHR